MSVNNIFLNLFFAGILFLTFHAYTQSQESSLLVFKDGEAQVVPEFADPKDWIREDLWVETEFDSDGDGKLDRMHVDVTRPQQTESGEQRLPVIYNTSPYFSNTSTSGQKKFWDIRHELGEAPPERKRESKVESIAKRPVISNRYVADWVPYGYVVVHSSSPGTGLSQGCPTVGGDNESLAPKAVIDWLCGRTSGYTTPDGTVTVTASWCSGKVGMIGVSYNGTLALAAATTGVDGLEAIIPIAPNTSYYHYYRSNGLVRSPGGYLGEDADYLYDYIHSGNPERADWCDCFVHDMEILPGIDRLTGDYNDFWAQRDYLNDISGIKAAMLMAHGFNDWNVMPEHSYRIYTAVRAMGLPVQLYYHQRGHGGRPPFSMMNRWFTRYLHGVENGVEEDARVWIVRENAPNNEATPYWDYPNPDASPVTFGVTPGAPEAGSLVFREVTESVIESLVDNYNIDGSTLAQTTSSEHRLLYLSEPLKEELHISGVPRITVRLACSKPAANLSVWLVSLPWNDERGAKTTDNIITRGWADPQNHDFLIAGEALTPGEFYNVTFDLQPDDQIIPIGQQIGLMIFSSDKEFTLWPEPGTVLMVDLEGTRLTLPVVGGDEAMGRAVLKQ